MNPLDSTFAVVLCLAMRGASNKFIAARTGFWQIRIHGIVPVNVSFSFCALVSSFPQKAGYGTEFGESTYVADISPC